MFGKSIYETSSLERSLIVSQLDWLPRLSDWPHLTKHLLKLHSNMLDLYCRCIRNKCTLSNFRGQRDYKGAPESHPLFWKPNMSCNQLVLTVYFDLKCVLQRKNWQFFFTFMLSNFLLQMLQCKYIEFYIFNQNWLNLTKLKLRNILNLKMS